MTTQHPDYYALLGVEPDATMAQIKKAYRKLARQHHPDTNPGDPQAAARFREITEAYDTLTDPERREAYDRTTAQPATGTKLAEPGPDTRAASLLVQVLEDTWLAIRRHHPQIPAVVIILASGTETRQPRWGHFASARWYVEHDERAEVMISGEALRLPPPRSWPSSCTKPPTPWPTHAASRTPPGRAATTTSSSRPTPKNSASPSSTTSATAGPPPRSPTTPNTPTPASSPPWPRP